LQCKKLKNYPKKIIVVMQQEQ